MLESFLTYEEVNVFGCARGPVRSDGNSADGNIRHPQRIVLRGSGIQRPQNPTGNDAVTER